MTPGDAFAEFAAALAARGIGVRFATPQDRAAQDAVSPALAADLAAIQQQIATLKEILMSLIPIVADLQAKLSTANATMAAAVLTIQQLRQAYDAAQEALAVAQATPPLPAGAVLLSADDQAALTAIGVSLPDSQQALADAIEANALLQSAPAAPVTP